MLDIKAEVCGPLDPLRNLKGAFQKMVDCFQCVAKPKGDGAEYNFEKFVKKRMGYDSDHRWEIVLLECQYGCPESQFVWGIHLYLQDKTSDALDYLKLAAAKNHAEAMFACAVLLHNQSMDSQPRQEVKQYFEQAAKDGILEAQYNYGLGLLAESTEIRDLRHGAEVLSWAAKEILLRRQCKVVHVDYGGKLCEFLYSPLPDMLTKRATDNYIWDHISENLAKIDRMSWNEILHPVIPTMLPRLESTTASPDQN